MFEDKVSTIGIDRVDSSCGPLCHVHFVVPHALCCARVCFVFSLSVHISHACFQVAFLSPKCTYISTSWAGPKLKPHRRRGLVLAQWLSSAIV